MSNYLHPKLIVLCVALFSFLIPSGLFAHCDTLNGPVIADARRALESGNVNPVLKWIKKEQEAEVVRTFQDVLKVRSLNAAAKQLADRSFLETVVRLHRAGENAPYTGLKSEPLEPLISEADKALQTGSIDVLSRMLEEEVKDQLRHRFQEALDKKENAEVNIESGRDYVDAYIEFVHYVEGLHAPSMHDKEQ